MRPHVRLTALRAARACGVPSVRDSSRFPQHADQDRPECPILLAVDQELGDLDEADG